MNANALPAVAYVENVRLLRGWATHVLFANGVVIKLSTRMGHVDAADEAKSIYSRMLEAGFTEAEIVALFREVKEGK